MANARHLKVIHFTGDLPVAVMGAHASDRQPYVTRHLAATVTYRRLQYVITHASLHAAACGMLLIAKLLAARSSSPCSIAESARRTQRFKAVSVQTSILRDKACCHIARIQRTVICSMYPSDCVLRQ